MWVIKDFVPISRMSLYEQPIVLRVCNVAVSFSSLILVFFVSVWCLNILKTVSPQPFNFFQKPFIFSALSHYLTHVAMKPIACYKSIDSLWKAVEQP